MQTRQHFSVLRTFLCVENTEGEKTVRTCNVRPSRPSAHLCTAQNSARSQTQTHTHRFGIPCLITTSNAPAQTLVRIPPASLGRAQGGEGWHSREATPSNSRPAPSPLRPIYSYTPIIKTRAVTYILYTLTPPVWQSLSRGGTPRGGRPTASSKVWPQIRRNAVLGGGSEQEPPPEHSSRLLVDTHCWSPHCTPADPDGPPNSKVSIPCACKTANTGNDGTLKSPPPYTTAPLILRYELGVMGVLCATAASGIILVSDCTREGQHDDAQRR